MEDDQLEYWIKVFSDPETEKRQRELQRIRNLIRRRWDGMIRRCHDPKSTAFPYYGGAGISVWSDWRKDFFIFYEWAIKNGFHPDLQIDRIDPAGDYEPDNCRWVTAKVNNQNRRKPRKRCPHCHQFMPRTTS